VVQFKKINLNSDQRLQKELRVQNKHIMHSFVYYGAKNTQSRKKINICKTLIRQVATYGAGSWTAKTDIANGLGAFEREVLRRMFGGTELNEYWRKAILQRFNAAVWRFRHAFIFRISRLIWIGQVNRMDSKRKVRQVFKHNPQGSQLRGRPKSDGGFVHNYMLINALIQIANVQKKRAYMVKYI